MSGYPPPPPPDQRSRGGEGTGLTGTAISLPRQLLRALRVGRLARHVRQQRRDELRTGNRLLARPDAGHPGAEVRELLVQLRTDLLLLDVLLARRREHVRKAVQIF